MNGKRIIVGVGLLVLAGAIVYSKIFSFGISTANVILGIVAVFLVASGIKQRNFFLILLPIAFMGHRLMGEVGILRYFPSVGFAESMGIAVLVAAGLTAIFGGKKKRLNKSHNAGYVEYGNGFNNSGAGGAGGAGGFFGGNGGAGGCGTAVDQNRFTQQPGPRGNGGASEYAYGNIPDDGDNVVIDNGFGKLTRYLHSTNLKKVKIDNGFGYCVVYYDNVVMDGSSKLKVDNGMGQVDVYIPPFFRFQMKQDNGFGSINVYGTCNMDPNAPLIDAEIKNGMGKVNIYFG